MAPIDDETLDRLLAGHLTDRLDGFVGRAEGAFRRLADVDAAARARRDVAPLRLVPADLGYDEDERTPAFGRDAPVPSSPVATGWRGESNARFGGDRSSTDPWAAGAGGGQNPDAQAFQQLARRPSIWNRNVGWVWGVVGTAAAAAVAAVLVLPSSPASSPSVTFGGGAGVINASPVGGPIGSGGSPYADQPAPPRFHLTHSQTFDEGTVAPPGAGTPVRRLRRQQVEHVVTYDPDRKVWVEVAIPREDVQRYEFDTY